MRLLTNGFTTAATTLAGSTALGSVYSSDRMFAAPKEFTIEKVTVHVGGTSVAPAGTDGLVSLRYGDSSDVAVTTMTICPQPQCTGGAAQGIQVAELSDLGIKAKWFQAITRTTAAGGVGVYIFGE